MEHNAGGCDFRTSQSWTILSPIEQSIKRKIEAVGVPLREWDINIYRGILTGCNEAFIITEDRRKEILNNCADDAERQRTEEVIRPILRGRDIKRYGYDKSGLYLINTHNGIKGKLERIHIEDYPAVKAHLDQYWDVISTRADRGDTPYNLRNCAYLEDFNKSQIVWIELSDKPKFTFVENMVSLNTVFFMTGSNLRHILGQLNSRLITWYFHKCLGARSGVGTNRWLKYTIEQLPLAPYDNSFSKFVENYSLENDEAIDIAVCDLFSLSEDEKRIVLNYSLS